MLNDVAVRRMVVAVQRLANRVADSLLELGELLGKLEIRSVEAVVRRRAADEYGKQGNDQRNDAQTPLHRGTLLSRGQLRPIRSHFDRRGVPRPNWRETSLAGPVAGALDERLMRLSPGAA